MKEVKSYLANVGFSVTSTCEDFDNIDFDVILAALAKRMKDLKVERSMEAFECTDVGEAAITADLIHKTMREGDTKLAMRMIDGYDVGDFWSDYASWLNHTDSNDEANFGSMADMVINYHNAKKG